MANIEQYPHIVKRLISDWGTNQGREYIQSLGIVGNERRRKGFPFEVFSDVVFLEFLHDAAFPMFKPHTPKEDAWDNVEGDQPSEHSPIKYIEYTI